MTTNRVIPITLLIAGAMVPAIRAEAAEANVQPRGHLGVLVEADAEFGGDNIAKVFYTNGSTQNIKAGQGITPAIGVHYHLANAPVDLAVVAGYKFVRTADVHSDLGLDRMVLKATGTYELPRHFWLDAGPVWHTNIQFHGDGYIPDFSFNDAVGATLGAGWRWVGVSYTNIHYHGPQIVGSVDASSVGVSLIFKF